VLAVQVPVRVERDVARVRVLSDHDVAAGVAHHLEPLAHGARMAGRLDHDVRAAPARAGAHPGRARVRIRRLRDVEHVVRPQATRGQKTLRGSADHEHGARARERREDRRVQPDGAAALHDHGVPECDARALDRVEARRQPAAAAHERARVDAVGQRQHPHAGAQLDALAPAAEQTVGGAGRDAVHAAVRAARGRARDQAVPAGAAHAEDVVERDEAPDLERAAVDIGERPVRLQHPPHADVPGDDRVRHAREPAVVQVHVGAAHLRQHHLEHGATRRGPRVVEGVQRERPTRPLHHDRADAHRAAVFGRRRSLPSGKW
jgi:hypothetical protein